MGRSPSAPIKDLDTLVMKRMRVYTVRGKYLQLQLFTKYITEADMVVRALGGKYYRHGTGYVWALSRMDSIANIYHQFSASYPSRSGFEGKIRDHLALNQMVSVEVLETESGGLPSPKVVDHY